VHVDCKKLARIVRPGHRVHGDRSLQPRRAEGFGILFAAVDDCSRLGFARLYPDETADSAGAFLSALASFYAQHGFVVERVLSDNGRCFRRRWTEAWAQRGIRARKTRPYRPQGNGKVERFIRTLLGEWAYARAYTHERERQACLLPYLDSYNRLRPHRALGGQTPLQRVNNVLGTNN
jgi:transposase InsO family protein